jgi:hypothetical protein
LDVDASSSAARGENSNFGGLSSSATTNGVHKKHLRKVLLSKNDKRRTYAKAFSEVFNSGDGKQLLNFLEANCTPTCEVIQSCVVKENPYIPKHVEVKGIQAIYNFWLNTFLTIPDCLLVLLETKLRIKNTATANRQNATSLTKDGEVIQTIMSAAISRAEGSSIVSSFSFTGTKLYNLDMKGAIIKETNRTNDETNLSSSVSDNLSAMVANPSSKAVTKPGLKLQKSSKKRKLNADWPKNGNDPSSSTTMTVGGDGGPGTGHVHNEKYTMFLHPPRRFSTLAGTPYGGTSNSGTYYHPPKSSLKSFTKTTDFVEITDTTKIEPGTFLETEGHINFLGTLTMFLDAENKITRFEFLYSHMD